MWKTVKLGELFKVGSSKRVLKADWREDGVPFYRGREITTLSAVGCVNNELFITEEHYRQLSEKSGVPTAGDIMITAIGTIGNTYIVEPNHKFYFKDASVLWLKKETEVSSEYIQYWLKTDDFYSQLDKGNGATVDTLTIKKLASVELSLPPLSEQQRIVEKLNAAFAEIDRAIQLGQERLLRTAKAFGQIVDIELGKLREKHESCLLGEMLESVEYGTSTKCLKSGRYPVLRMGNIQAGSITMDELVYLDGEEEFEKYRVRKGDVFFNRTNSALHVGKSAIYEGREDCLFAGYLIRLNYSERAVDGRFLNYYLNAPSTRTHGYSVMTSSVNQSNINGTKLKQYPFFKVDLETQLRIRKKLDDITALLSQAQFALEKTLNEFAQLKSAILAQELQSPHSEAA